MKSIALAAFVLLGVMSTSAMALDLSKARCETDDVRQVINKMLPTMRFENGRSFASEGFSANSVVSLSTISAEKNRLVCKIVLNLGVRGNSQNIRGKFTFRQFGSGRLTAEWSPFS